MPNIQPPNSQSSLRTELDSQQQDYQVDDSHSPVKPKSSSPAKGRKDVQTREIDSQKLGAPNPRSQDRTTPGSDGRPKNNSANSTVGSTQAFSQGFFNETMDELKRKDPHTSFVTQVRSEQPIQQPPVETDKTYATGQAGHIDLHSTKPVQQGDAVGLVEEDTEHSEDDFDLPKLFSDPAYQFPEDQRFKTPKSQATRGKKRNLRGEVKSSPGATPMTTPRLPVNPFGGFRPPNTGKMSMSQAFKATQAPSSPLPQIPTSDGMSERPSPNLYNVQRQNLAIVSSPAQIRRSDHSQNDPHNEYVPRAASQEEREKQITPPISNDDQHSDSIDLMAPSSSDIRRQYQKAQERRHREARNKLEGITAAIDLPARGRGRGRGNGRGRAVQYGRGGGKGARAAASNLDVILSSTEASPAPSPEPEPRRTKRVRTLPGADSAIDEVMEVDEAGEGGRAVTPASLDLDSDETQIQRSDDTLDHPQRGVRHADKENVDGAPVQVPRTVTKGSRHFHIASRPDDEEPGLAPYLTESQQLAANSQPDPTPTVQREAGRVIVPDSTQAIPSEVARAFQDRLGGVTEMQPSALANGAKSGSRGRVLGNTTITISNLSDYNCSSDDESDGQRTPGPEPHDRSIQPKYAKMGGSPSQGLAAERNAKPSPARPKVPDSDEAVLDTPKKRHLAAPATPNRLSEHVSPSRRSQAHRSASSRKVASAVKVPESPPSRLRLRPETAEVRRIPRKFEDILPGGSQASQGLGIDEQLFDVLEDTEEHKRYKRLVLDSPDPSPVKSFGKRSRRPGDARRMPSPARSKREDALQLSTSQAEVTTNEYFTADQSTNARNLPVSSITSPEQPLSSSQPSNVSEKENFHPVRAKRPIIVSTQDTDRGSEKEVNDERAETSKPGRQNVRRPRVRPPRIESSEAATPQSTFPSQATISQLSSRKIVPTRVWAHFTGTPAGFYPAICIEPVEHNRFKVRFDDDKETTVPSSTVRRLELRIGDAVKVADARKQTFIVTELLDKMQSVSKKALTLADMYGWTKVKLATKNKGGELIPHDRIVAIKDLYLTNPQFNGLADRLYIHYEATPGDTRPATPSDCLSNPDTPSSRSLRRPKFSTSKSTITTNQSFRSISVKSGLFAGMAFAATALDRDMKAELQKTLATYGGAYLEDGLIPLFEVPDIQLTQSSDGDIMGEFGLRKEHSSLGFTAVITNKYSRTTTYLCALALNIPCLTIHWIRDCVKQGQVLDWRRYLLASGESKTLDGAVISRSIEFPAGSFVQGAATEPTLGSLLGCRNKIAEEQRVLLVSDRKTSEKDSTLTFVSYALGASKVYFADGIKEANDFLDDPRTECDLVCLLTSDETAGDELGASASRSRRRKSQRTGGAGGLSIAANTRLIDNEGMVQSLVLGRLVVD